MSYETPVVEIVDHANGLIKNYMGPMCDGDGEQLSQLVTVAEE